MRAKVVDKIRLFEFLSTQDSSVLLALLSKAFDTLDYDQRQQVFGQCTRSQSFPLAQVQGELLLAEVEEFRRESLAGRYWAPFNMNSKNFMHVPEETKEWFERLGDFLEASGQLTVQGDHEHAVACFGVLYELIEAMESGDEIVFAEELGSWMIPTDERQAIAAYLTSLAATATPKAFTAVALPLIRRDSRQSFADQVYTAATAVASAAQKAHLEAEIQRQGIRTTREL